MDFYTSGTQKMTISSAGNVGILVTAPLSTLHINGSQSIKGTDVNAAGPYVVTATDYAIEVRYTATGAISINLPSIATVGNGRIIVVIDSGYNASVNNITLIRNGADKINNVAANYVQTVSGSCIWLKANTTTSNWEIV
jgi:hypothetical protein